MTMSRMALVAAAFQSQAPPPLVTAEKAFEMHRQRFEGTVSFDSGPVGPEGEDIVVCGRGGDSPYRYTGPVAREPGAPETLPRGSSAGAQSVGGCLFALSSTRQGRRDRFAGAIAKGIGKLLDSDR